MAHVPAPVERTPVPAPVLGQLAAADGSCSSDAMSSAGLRGVGREEGSKVLAEFPAGLILSARNMGRTVLAALGGEKVVSFCFCRG